MNKNQLYKFLIYNGFNALLQEFNIPLYKPLRIGFLVTFDCNLRCKNCRSWKRGKAFMSATEGEGYITKILEWYKYPFYITFSGGEPLILKHELFRMIKFASTKGIMTHVVSNGTLIDNQVKKALIDAGLYSISISLDSLDASVHDDIHGKKGMHHRVMKGISLLKTSNIKINISTTLMSENSKRIPELVEWVKNNHLHNITFQSLQPISWRIRPISRTWFKETSSWPQTKEMIKVIDSLIKMKKKGYPIANSIKYFSITKDYFKNPLKKLIGASCAAGKNYLFVDPKGNLFFCTKYGFIGNLNLGSLESVFKSDLCKDIKKKISNCEKESCVLYQCYFKTPILNDIYKFLKR